MIRKIIGFLPVLFWLAMLFFGGGDFSRPDEPWDITRVPLTIWIWFGLSVLSGILLCFDGSRPIGLITGIIPYAYFAIIMLTSGTYTGLVFPGIFLLFYALYAVVTYKLS